MRTPATLILLTLLGTVEAARLDLPSLVHAADRDRIHQADGPAVAVYQVSTPNRPAVALPDLSDGLFPCSNCHAEMQPDPRRRVLRDEHGAISLQHAAGQFWCLDCHHPENRDVLHLISGESIPLTESYRLCGQCHGKQLRAWHAGLHGKRTGHWNGDKVSLLCTHCHDPHTPKFKALKPMPPPALSGRTGG